MIQIWHDSHVYTRENNQEKSNFWLENKWIINLEPIWKTQIADQNVNLPDFRDQKMTIEGRTRIPWSGNLEPLNK